MLKISLSKIALAITLMFPVFSSQAEILIDAIVAVVDGEPITLSDLEKYMNKQLPRSLEELAKMEDAKTSLNELIEMQVMENEAKDRRISVKDSEIDRYVNEIAARNNLSLEEFDQALKEQGSNLQDFQKKTKSEILRSKLANSILTRDVAVADDEAEKVIAKKKVSKKDSKTEKVKFAQIFLSSKQNSSEQISEKINEIKQGLAREAPFSSLAAKYSDGIEKNDGGALPLMAAEDLNPQIQEILAALSDGEVSAPVRDEDGIRIFQLIKRYSAEDSNDGLVDEAKEDLRSKKVESALQKFFVSDMYKKHTVDKKI